MKVSKLLKRVSFAAGATVVTTLVYKKIVEKYSDSKSFKLGDSLDEIKSSVNDFESKLTDIDAKNSTKVNVANNEAIEEELEFDKISDVEQPLKVNEVIEKKPAPLDFETENAEAQGLKEDKVFEDKSEPLDFETKNSKAEVLKAEVLEDKSEPLNFEAENAEEHILKEEEVPEDKSETLDFEAENAKEHILKEAEILEDKSEPLDFESASKIDSKDNEKIDATDDYDFNSDENYVKDNNQHNDLENYIAKENEAREKYINSISSFFPYVSLELINNVYDQKEEINTAYEMGKHIKLFHLVKFSNSEDINDFINILNKNNYSYEIELSSHLVEVVNEINVKEGVILTDIYVIANQAGILNGIYQSFSVEELD